MVGIKILAIVFSGIILGFIVRNIFISRCSFPEEFRIIQGSSLAGTLEAGDKVKILDGYYDCYPVQRNDILVYRYGDRLIIKIAKGLPRDKFSIKKTEDGTARILINNQILANEQKQPYILDDQAYQLLSLYVKDYAGIIPEDTYLIFGNLASGSLDSSHFGLISKKDILGKVSK